MDKQIYYQRKDVVDGYDDWRFGTPGGRYVDALEKAAIVGFLSRLPREVEILDMPCGTGRLLRALEVAGFTSLTGGDASSLMLERARAASRVARLFEVDAFRTGLPEATYDVVCSLRFLFHVENASNYLAEIARLLKPGGSFVFDTLLWTPRGWIPPIDRALGGRLFCYREPRLKQLLAAHGLEQVAAHRILLLPSFAYRYIPSWLIPVLRWCERHVPTVLFSKSVILARRLPAGAVAKGTTQVR